MYSANAKQTPNLLIGFNQRRGLFNGKGQGRRFGAATRLANNTGMRMLRQPPRLGMRPLLCSIALCRTTPNGLYPVEPLIYVGRGVVFFETARGSVHGARPSSLECRIDMRSFSCSGTIRPEPIMGTARLSMGQGRRELEMFGCDSMLESWSQPGKLKTRRRQGRVL